MVERHSEVGEDTIHFARFIVKQEIAQEAEVAVDQSEPRVGERSFKGIGVLIESIQMTAFGFVKALYYRAGVTSAAEGDVDIFPSGTDVQCLKRLGQQSGYMVNVLIH